MKTVNTFGSLKPMLKETTSKNIKIASKPSIKKSLTKQTKFSKLKSSLKV